MFIEVTVLGARRTNSAPRQWETAVKMTLNSSQIIKIVPGGVFEKTPPKTSLTFKEGNAIVEYFTEETKAQIDEMLHTRSAGIVETDKPSQPWYAQ